MSEPKPPAKKPAARKPAAKKKPIGRTPKGPKAQANKRAGVKQGSERGGKETRQAVGKVAGTKVTKKKLKPKGAPKKPANKSQRSIRDSRIVALRGMGFGFKDIGEMVGLSTRQTERNYYDRVENLPDLLEMKPLEVIRNLIHGFQNAILDFEQMAQDADQTSAAVGAKKGANESRVHLLRLLQATGQLPYELGTMRHEVEVGHVVTVLLDTVEAFTARINSIDLGDGKKEVIDAAAEVSKTLEQLAAGEEPEMDSHPQRKE